MPAPKGLVQWQIPSLCLPLNCPRNPDCPCRKRRPDCRLPIETLLYLHKGEKEPPRTLIHFYEKRGNWGGRGGGKGGNPPHTFRRGLLGPYVRHQIVPSWLSWFTSACALEPRSNCNPAVLTTIFFFHFPGTCGAQTRWTQRRALFAATFSAFSTRRRRLPFCAQCNASLALAGSGSWSCSSGQRVPPTAGPWPCLAMQAFCWRSQKCSACLLAALQALFSPLAENWGDVRLSGLDPPLILVNPSPQATHNPSLVQLGGPTFGGLSALQCSSIFSLTHTRPTGSAGA